MACSGGEVILEILKQEFGRISLQRGGEETWKRTARQNFRQHIK